MTAVAPAGGMQAPPRRDAHLRISALLPEGPWQWAAVAIAGLVLAPLLALAWTALQGGQAGLWPHIARYVLPPAALNTTLLLAGAGEIGRASCRDRVCQYV